MAFQLSPGVLITEEDRTTVVPSVATTAGAFSGAFQWGPVDQVVTIDTENSLVERFGKPNDTVANYFFTAANFLSYGNNLQIVRNVNKAVAKNAVSQTTGSVSAINLVNTSNGFTLTDTITVTIDPPVTSNGANAVASAVLADEGQVKEVTFTARGYGYAEPPTITFTGGGGSGATAVATLATGELANVFVTVGGNNYNSNSNIVFSDGGAGATQATANLVINYSVSGISIIDAGNAYHSSNSNVVFVGGTSGNIAVGNLILGADGVITGIDITDVGDGYTSVPTVVIYRNDSNVGLDANITANLGYGTIVGVEIIDDGGSYTSAPNVTINKNSLLGGDDANVTARIRALVNTITMTDLGSGYTSVPTVDITRSANDYTGFGNASATAVLMFPISNISITNPGSGYLTAPNISISSASGLQANATANIQLTSVLILNSDNYDASYSTGGLLFGEFAARYPGVLGNSLKVSIADSATFANWQYSNQFDAAPSTSAYVAGKGGSNDEMHVIVIDAGSEITGTAGTVLEKFSFLSKASDSKNSDASTNYYKDVINSQSKYVWWMNHPTNSNWGNTSTSTFTSLSGAIDDRLVGGVDGNELSSGNVLAGYQIFSNDELYDVSLIPMGPSTDIATVNSVIGIAETRRDCMVFASPPYVSVVNTTDQASRITTHRDSLTSSSFAVLDSGWKYQYDRYNDRYRYVPLNGDTAGLAARTDFVADPWFSPAGYNRGVLKNVVKLAYSPSKTDRDTLYKKGVNPIVTFPGQGTLLFGDKTLLSRPSAFDRINVRRLFIVLEKAIATAAKFQLFEFNDAFTRAQFRNLVEPFLRDVQGRRGITDFRVICDETNNTGEVIDRNEFVADIYIKPARSINFIQLNFVATRSGVSFEEVGA